MKKKNRAGQSLKMAASSLSKSKTPLGDYSRKMRAKFGGKGAALATAHKLSRIMYTMIRDQKEYDPNIMFDSQEKAKQQKIKRLENQLEKLKRVA